MTPWNGAWPLVAITGATIQEPCYPCQIIAIHLRNGLPNFSWVAMIWLNDITPFLFIPAMAATATCRIWLADCWHRNAKRLKIYKRLSYKKIEWGLFHIYLFRDRSTELPTGHPVIREWYGINIMVSQIINISTATFYITVCSGQQQRKPQSSTSLALANRSLPVTGGFPLQMG